MVRRIIQIDEEKCNGCGACADACHEGAIGMIDGKAKLLRDDYCDGLGDCLPACPVNAITFVEREAAAYDEAAVLAAKGKKACPSGGGCPGSAAKTISRPSEEKEPIAFVPKSQLRNWPVQIKLAPMQSSYFDGAKLLVAADCTAYSYANFHQEFIRDHANQCHYGKKCNDQGLPFMVIPEIIKPTVKLAVGALYPCGAAAQMDIMGLKLFFSFVFGLLHAVSSLSKDSLATL